MVKTIKEKKYHDLIYKVNLERWFEVWLHK